VSTLHLRAGHSSCSLCPKCSSPTITWQSLSFLCLCSVITFSRRLAWTLLFNTATQHHPILFTCNSLYFSSFFHSTNS
jgi:hypothetical protein